MVQRTRSWDWRLGLAGVLVVGGAIVLSGNCALAQITPDGTLGAEDSQVVSPFPGGFQIDGGATRGTNLFHSFQAFSVPTNGIAYFNNALNIQNIMTRVTGGSASNIDGLITANGTANLFLINPKGILFGPNAWLDIGGSFLASTASSVVFGNGFKFSATNPESPSLLTINVPIGLQYGSNPGSLVNQSFIGLQVQSEKTLALVGGNVVLEGGFLIAPDGRIELGSVAGNNLVSLKATNTGYTLGYEDVTGFQDVTLVKESGVATSGNGGGSIEIRGRNVTLSDKTLVLADTWGSQYGGGVSIQASKLKLQDGSWVSADVLGSGQGGNVMIETGLLLVQDGAGISASTYGSGNGGNLIVNASDSVQLMGISPDGRLVSGLFAASEGTGAAGDLRITTGQVLVQDGARINTGTYGAGNAGNLLVQARDAVEVTGAGSYLSTDVNITATGAGGNLTIQTGRLSVRDGAIVSADTYGAGNAGNLLVQARDAVEVTGAGSYLSTDVNRTATGAGGNLTIQTGRLSVRDGANVSASTYGSGNGGNLIVNASDSVQLMGISPDGRLVSGLFADSEGTGAAGDLRITTGQVLVQDGARINTGTYGAGNAGNLLVQARDAVEVTGAGSYLSTDVNRTATGAGGNLTIQTGRLSVRDGAIVSADTYGAGNAGNLLVQGHDVVEVGLDSYLSTDVNGAATGAGGNLTIQTERLSVRDGGRVSVSTYGSGNGGSLIVNASESVRLIGESTQSFSGLFASSEEGRGTAGDIRITTQQLLVSDGATVCVSTRGSGQAGSLIINASDSVELSGISAISQSSSRLLAHTTGSGLAGNLIIDTARLIVQDGAQVSASTFGSGQGGSLIVNASDSVELSGISADGWLPSGLFTRTEGTGAAGDLRITTQHLHVSNGAWVDASTFGEGNAGNLLVQAHGTVEVTGAGSYLSADVNRTATGAGGNLTIQAERMSIREGAVVSADTYGDGNAGNLLVQARDSVEVTGAGSSLSTEVLSAAIGHGGDMRIQTGQLIVQDGAEVAVSSRGSGDAGNLDIAANLVWLDYGEITAQTAKGNGGNITMSVEDLLLLRHGSKVSTTAGTAQSGGDGGNLTINAPFIVAVPKENSDITANAYTGQGGNINITTQGLFGIEYRPRLTPLSDITASSEFGVNGTVAINTPGVDPSRGLAQLPTNLVHAEELIDRHCIPNQSSDQRSSFTVTGRGGLPPSPNEPLRNEEVITHWITLPSEEESPDAATNNQPTNSTNQPLVEAQGWAINEQGQVVLTAETTTVTPQTSWLPSPSCPSSQTGTQ